MKPVVVGTVEKQRSKDLHRFRTAFKPQRCSRPTTGDSNEGIARSQLISCITKMCGDAPRYSSIRHVHGKTCVEFKAFELAHCCNLLNEGVPYANEIISDHLRNLKELQINLKQLQIAPSTTPSFSIHVEIGSSGILNVLLTSETNGQTTSITREFDKFFYNPTASTARLELHNVQSLEHIFRCLQLESFQVEGDAARLQRNKSTAGAVVPRILWKPSELVFGFAVLSSEYSTHIVKSLESKDYIDFLQSRSANPRQEETHNFPGNKTRAQIATVNPTLDIQSKHTKNKFFNNLGKARQILAISRGADGGFARSQFRNCISKLCRDAPQYSSARYVDGKTTVEFDPSELAHCSNLISEGVPYANEIVWNQLRKFEELKINPSTMPLFSLHVEVENHGIVKVSITINEQTTSIIRDSNQFVYTSPGASNAQLFTYNTKSLAHIFNCLKLDRLAFPDNASSRKHDGTVDEVVPSITWIPSELVSGFVVLSSEYCTHIVETLNCDNVNEIPMRARYPKSTRWSDPSPITVKAMQNIKQRAKGKQPARASETPTTQKESVVKQKLLAVLAATAVGAIGVRHLTLSRKYTASSEQQRSK